LFVGELMRGFCGQRIGGPRGPEGQGSLPYAQIAFEPSFFVSDGIHTRWAYSDVMYYMMRKHWALAVSTSWPVSTQQPLCAAIDGILNGHYPTIRAYTGLLLLRFPANKKKKIPNKN
jgi:hypothetical protein